MAERIGDQRLIGIVMFNLAYLDKDLEAIEYAIGYMKEKGYEMEAERLLLVAKSLQSN